MKAEAEASVLRVTAVMLTSLLAVVGVLHAGVLGWGVGLGGWAGAGWVWVCSVVIWWVGFMALVRDGV